MNLEAEQNDEKSSMKIKVPKRDEDGKPIKGFFQKIQSTFMKTVDTFNTNFNKWMKEHFKDGASGIAGWAKELFEKIGIDVDGYALRFHTHSVAPFPMKISNNTLHTRIV